MLQYRMESRRSRRLIVNWPAEIIVRDKRYACSIENISFEGVYAVTAPTKFSTDFNNGSRAELRFRLPSGEKIRLHCRIQWSHDTPPHGYTRSIGLAIENPPLSFQNLLQTLH